jgi:hypothetical protein
LHNYRCQNITSYFIVFVRSLCRVFKKALYNDIPNVTLWRVAKTFTFEVIQTIHRSRCWTVDSLDSFKCKCFYNAGHTVTAVKLFLKHAALLVEVTLNRNYLR